MERSFRILVGGSLILAASATAGSASDERLPGELRETLRADATAFTPQYPLWSDGQDKRRWLHLPAGASIDKSNPDRWEFPVGTRAWKEFSRAGAKVETRFIERLRDGSWRYATYLWNSEGTKALLAPEEGVPTRGIPSRADCVACHEGAPAPILGYSAVQLETRLAPALGYLHGNCGHCHNDGALPALDLVFAQSAADPTASAMRTAGAVLARRGRFRHDQPRGEVIVARMKSQDPNVRMPPIGVQVADARGIATLERWITTELRQLQENSQ